MEDQQAHTATFGCIPVRGGTYQGQWRDSLRHGHGKMVYKDRRVYEGEWTRDRRHGFGTLTFPGCPGKVRLTLEDPPEQNVPSSPVRGSEAIRW